MKMSERAHPDDPGFKTRWFGFKSNPYRRMLYGRYEFCCKYIVNKIVCDIPCGSGWGTSLLNGYTRLIGIDIDENAINYAKIKYENKRMKFLVGNMMAIPLADNSIDVLLCLEGFEHVAPDVGLIFIDESKRVIKKNGLIIMTCPVLNDKGEHTANPYHLSEYNEENLISLINTNYRIQVLERIVGPDSPLYRIIAINIKNKRYD